MKTLKILYIDHSFHQNTRSTIFFSDHLSSMGETTVVYDDSWKGRAHFKDYTQMIKDYDLVVVFQLPSVMRRIARQRKQGLVFVPMYDAAYTLKGKFWKSIRHVKIVCFSAAMEAICRGHQLDTYFLQYYPPAHSLCPTGYTTKRLFFWQRHQDPGWREVTSHLPLSQFEKSHLHLAPDPDVEPVGLPTESESALHCIQSSRWFEKKAEFVNVLQQYNLFFCPRKYEGIGQSFLDAMAGGLIPIGYNNPTYNEYVVNGINGFIVGNAERLDLPPLEPIADHLSHYLRKGRINYERKLGGLTEFLLKKTSTGWILPIPSKYRYKLEQRKIHPVVRSRERNSSPSPLVTVVTVVWNDMAGLSKTFNSVFDQTSRDFEYLVMDGGSADGTYELAKSHEGSIDQLISSKDNGPFDAMYKSLAHAKGQYVIFMNAGDEFADPTALESALEMAPRDVDIIYGHHYFINRRSRHRASLAKDLGETYRNLLEGNVSEVWRSGIPCHQSTIVRRELLLEHGFDPEFRVAADHDFLFKVCSNGAKFYHSNTFIAKYYSGGYSSKMKDICNQNWKDIAVKYTADPEKVAKLYDF